MLCLCTKFVWMRCNCNCGYNIHLTEANHARLATVSVYLGLSRVFFQNPIQLSMRASTWQQFWMNTGSVLMTVAFKAWLQTTRPIWRRWGDAWKTGNGPYVLPIWLISFLVMQMWGWSRLLKQLESWSRISVMMVVLILHFTKHRDKSKMSWFLLSQPDGSRRFWCFSDHRSIAD